MKNWLMLMLLLAAYLFAFGRILGQWAGDVLHDGNYGHVLPMAAILLGWGFFRSRRISESSSTSPGAWAWIWLIAGMFLALISILGSDATLGRIGSVAMLLSAIHFFLPVAHRRIWQPVILAMLLLIPWPYVIFYAATAQLQRISTSAAALLLTWSGIPLVQDGNLLRLPGYQLEVVEACSGLRSLLSLTALAALLGVLARLSWSRVLLLLALAIPLAWLGNLMRLVLAGYAAQLLGPDQADGLLHLAGGVLSFAMGILFLGWLALRWAREGRDRS